MQDDLFIAQDVMIYVVYTVCAKMMFHYRQDYVAFTVNSPYSSMEINIYWKLISDSRNVANDFHINMHYALGEILLYGNSAQPVGQGMK